LKKFIIISFFIIFPIVSNADYSYRNTSKLRPNDYLLNSRDRGKDPVFDGNATANLGVDLGIGSDCGRVDIKSTLRASLKNLLDAQYFGDMGRDILAASPMLVTCYFSPTWCAILKHTRMNANFLSQLRLDQCSLIDKYTDSRTEDFYKERQKCIHKAIERNGGNMEAAMKECSNSRVFDYDLADWTGKNGNSSNNKLIESSSKWAGLKGKSAQRVIDLTKSLVGDMVVSKGKVSLDYGPKKIAMTPRTYYQSIMQKTKEELSKVIDKTESKYEERPVEAIVTKNDLEAVSGSSDMILIDKQTIKSLVFMPYRQQEMAVNKLSEAIALTRFSSEMNKTLDLLHIAEQNPNLPDSKKTLLKNKRDSLESSVKLTLELHNQRNEPLNKVLASISKEGEQWVNVKKGKTIRTDFGRKQKYHLEREFWNCADGMFCKER